MPFSRLYNSIEKFLGILVARDGILSASKFEFCPLGGQPRVTLFGRNGVGVGGGDGGVGGRHGGDVDIFSVWVT